MANRPGFRFIGPATALLLLTGCGGNPDTAAIGPATSQILAQVAAKDYGPVWDQAPPQLRAGQTRAAFIASMEAIGARMGACQTPVKADEWKGQATRDAFYTNQDFTSVCANGPVKITLSLVLSGTGAPKLLGYQVQSPLLPPAG